MNDLYAEMVQLVKDGCVACPKCALEAKSMLHRFCQNDPCPVRDALGLEKQGGMLEPFTSDRSGVKDV
jgi:hypothetical protein